MRSVAGHRIDESDYVNRASQEIAGATGIVLATLAAGQFVMALDTTVMNTAIATVADDAGTTVTGIQTAITLYTLVMATVAISGLRRIRLAIVDTVLIVWRASAHRTHMR
jgi:hypothetical protein